MGLFSRNKKGTSYNYKKPADQARAAKHLISHLNAGKIDPGARGTHPGAQTMMADENGVPVFVEYIGLVGGRPKWKQPDALTDGHIEEDVRRRKRAMKEEMEREKRKKAGVKEEVGGLGGFVAFGGRGMPMAVGGFYESVGMGRAVDGSAGGVFNGGVGIGAGAMGGGGLGARDEPGPVVFGGGMGVGGITLPGPVFNDAGFNMRGRGIKDQRHPRFRHQGPVGWGTQAPFTSGQNSLHDYSQNYHHTTSPRFEASAYPSSLIYSSSYNSPHPSDYQSRRHDFNPNFSSTPQAQPALQSPSHQQQQPPPTPHFKQPQQQPGSAFLPPPAIVVDPLATQDGPLGMHGKRAYVPGQTELQKRFSGSQTEPEQRYKYLAELEKLREENARRGVR